MNDICDRLRQEGADALRQHYSLGMWKLCQEAADEIHYWRSLVERAAPIITAAAQGRSVTMAAGDMSREITHALTPALTATQEPKP